MERICFSFSQFRRVRWFASPNFTDCQDSGPEPHLSESWAKLSEALADASEAVENGRIGDVNDFYYV